MKRWFSSASLLALLCAFPTASFAGVPDPFNSIVDPCFRLEPNGEIPFTVQVRDLANNPVIGSFIVIDYCGCPDLVLCPGGGGRPNVHGPSCTIEGTTDGAGIRVFNIRGGGGCVGQVKVYADGVLLRVLAAVSPDQNGDLQVNGADLALLSAKIGLPDPTGDLDCDGSVTAADEATLALYMNHSCLDPTKGRPRTWGEMKILYR